MILVCGGIKGGSGKTTIATNLAVMRAGAGRDVLLVDADEQESATIFTAIRKREHTERPQYTSIILRDSQVRTELERMRDKYDDIIVDTGGRDTRSQRASLSLADILLLPFNPRSLDIWTLENVEKLLEDMRTINPKLRAVSFLNRADPVGTDNQESREILTDISSIEFANVTIVNRKAFGKAVALGLSVMELRQPDRRRCKRLWRYISMFSALIKSISRAILVCKWSSTMAEKAVSRRPRDIDAVINRGGSSATSQEDNPEKERVFNLRVPESLVEQVDALRKQRTGRISRNTWILEAIEDKVERETQARG